MACQEPYKHNLHVPWQIWKVQTFSQPVAGIFQPTIYDLGVDLRPITFKSPSLTLYSRETTTPSPIFTLTLLNTNQKNSISNYSKNIFDGNKLSVKILEAYRYIHKITVSETCHETQFKILHRAYYPFCINKTDPTQAQCP